METGSPENYLHYSLIRFCLFSTFNYRYCHCCFTGKMIMFKILFIHIPNEQAKVQRWQGTKNRRESDSKGTG